MKVYHIHGIRHQAVVFAETPEEAIAQAVERELVNPWETPEAVEVPLPKGYRIIYDRLAGSMAQAELPLSIDAPEPDPRHTVTRSGVKVYDDWRDNIIVDADAPPVTWKAKRDTFGAHTSVPGRSRLASENSEDALSWNLFRTLEKAGRLDAITHAQEFTHFRQCLRLPTERTHLLTWQALLTHAEATFDPAVRPLLAHTARLSYLQPA